MARRAFVLRVKPNRVDEYIAAHAEVWPELLAALREAGVRNFSIFRDGSRMFGYLEADDLDASDDFLASHPVNLRWQEKMAGLLAKDMPEAGLPWLEEVFRLD